MYIEMFLGRENRKGEVMTKKMKHPERLKRMTAGGGIVLR
jgi:hypothetical protein